MASLTDKMRAADTARFCARVKASFDAMERPKPKAPSPAMQTAIAAVEDHGRRWVAVRVETNRELGRTEPPARDTRLDLSLAPAAKRSPTGALL